MKYCIALLGLLSIFPVGVSNSATSVDKLSVFFSANILSELESCG